MLNLGTFFWITVTFFGLIGILRGWTREVVATSGLILSLFTINQFGYFMVNILGATYQMDTVDLNTVMDVRRQQYYILALTHIFIAFFSYQGPTWAGRVNDRLRIRDSFQDKILGLLVGGINGYLIVGTFWALLENEVISGGFRALPTTPFVNYPFEAEIIFRPEVGSSLYALISNLPIPLLAPYLPFLLVVVFLFVIVVMI